MSSSARTLMIWRPMRRAVAGLALAALLAGGCATSSVYLPRTQAGGAGYSQARLDATHWRVEFIGDDVASAEIVERYLLFRAAELTVESGYEWFLPSAHAAWSDTEIVVQALPSALRSPVWRPQWRHRGTRGWSAWDLHGPAPRRLEEEERADYSWSFERYAARQDIVMGRGAAPANAFNAAAVAELLAPAIVRP